LRVAGSDWDMREFGWWDNPDDNGTSGCTGDALVQRERIADSLPSVVGYAFDEYDRRVLAFGSRLGVELGDRFGG